MNELRELAYRLEGYQEQGWEIVRATKCGDKWELLIQPIEQKSNGKEGKHENNK